MRIRPAPLVLISETYNTSEMGVWGLTLLVNIETQKPPETSAEVISIALSDNEDASGSAEISNVTIEQVHKELLSLSLQQADVQERIRAIRRALTALLNVFGPGILNEQLQVSQAFAHQASCWRSTTADLCREILKRSPRWLTICDMLAVIRRESPLTLARFINPGVSLSNALRALQRHSQVEAKLDDDGRREWRWVGEQKETADFERHASRS
jgi:hypothetical protein